MRNKLLIMVALLVALEAQGASATGGYGGTLHTVSGGYGLPSGGYGYGGYGGYGGSHTSSSKLSLLTESSTSSPREFVLPDSVANSLTATNSSNAVGREGLSVSIQVPAAAAAASGAEGSPVSGGARIAAAAAAGAALIFALMA